MTYVCLLHFEPAAPTFLPIPTIDYSLVSKVNPSWVTSGFDAELIISSDCLNHFRVVSLAVLR